MNTWKRAGAVLETVSETDLYLKSSDFHMGATPPALKIAMLNAGKAPAAAAAFFERKQACYARFGAASASVATATSVLPRANAELNLVIAFEPDTGVMVGGLALYGRSADSPLPLESAIVSVTDYTGEIAAWHGRKIVEFGGFWMEDVWRKTGLSEQIVLAAITACHCMGTDKIVALAHHHVIDSYRQMGVVPDYSLGEFHYPTPDYITRMIWADPVGFSTLPDRKIALVKSYARLLATRGVISWRNDRLLKTG